MKITLTLAVCACLIAIIMARKPGAYCPKGCTDNYAPVCGHDPNGDPKYETFSNRCQLEVSNECDLTNYKYINDGPCQSKIN